jgi:hypothetical protein
MAQGYLTGNRGRDAKPAKKILAALNIRLGADGGHIIQHQFSNSGAGPYHESDEYPFSKAEGAKALAHIAKHMGIKGDVEKGETDSAKKEAAEGE